jgi:hypothetical protein
VSKCAQFLDGVSCQRQSGFICGYIKRENAAVRAVFLELLSVCNPQRPGADLLFVYRYIVSISSRPRPHDLQSCMEKEGPQRSPRRQQILRNPLATLAAVYCLRSTIFPVLCPLHIGISLMEPLADHWHKQASPITAADSEGSILVSANLNCNVSLPSRAVLPFVTTTVLTSFGVESPGALKLFFCFCLFSCFCYNGI